LKNQANEIRKDIFNILKTSSDLKNITPNIKGIRYSELKRTLLNTTKYTEGAVTSVLNTVTKKSDYVHKIKIDTGTYYYYSEKKLQLKDNSDFLESLEYRNLKRSVDNLVTEISDILKNISKENNNIKITDSNYELLRELLNYASSMSIKMEEQKISSLLLNVENKLKEDSDPFNNLPF
jgi:Holliday junction resolvase RusA-like endonuclease